MAPRETVTLARDIAAVIIPYGTSTTLPAGSVVTIVQTLGGNYTVETAYGELARIAAADAGALGKQAPAAGEAPSSGTEQPQGGEAGRADEGALPGLAALEERAWEALRSCYDPEIPVNIVDLGLVYECKITPSPSIGYSVDVKLTLTAPGCGMGGVLREDAYGKLARIPGVTDVNVELVVDPPWNPSLMSEAARLQLGMF